MKPKALNALHRAAIETGSVPLTFVQGGDYLNLGDALSPVMVALLSGLPVRAVEADKDAVRMGAVGTIAHMFRNGEVWIWGTGTSRHANPLDKSEDKRLFVADAQARFRVTATRGPVTRRILGEANAEGAPAYGDPVWLLPQFYPRPPQRRWALGVIVHLSDLTDRSVEVAVNEAFLRYNIPESLRGSVRLINTVTGTEVGALKDKLDEILSCERLVSTSLHGMVFAESYRIPCLYFSPRGKKAGLAKLDLLDEDRTDLRIIDLYRGLGREELNAYVQPRKRSTDWEKLIDTIDCTWEPIEFDTAPLVESFPLPLAPVEVPQAGSVFDLPLIRELPVQSGRKKAADKPPGKRGLGRRLAARLRRKDRD